VAEAGLYNGGVAAPASTLLPAILGLLQRQNAPLSEYTRFGIGGPADLLVEASEEGALVEALRFLRHHHLPHVVIGSGTNLVVSDAGFRGTVVRYTAAGMHREENAIWCDAGAELMDLVRFTLGHALEGIQTLMGIPGSVGGAIYGNAGAYGHSISEVTREVRYFDGDAVRTLNQEGCAFRYRESLFKQRKHWMVLAVRLEFQAGDGPALRKTAEEILAVRNEKFPPTMRCAGSIFKNLLFDDLPESVTRQVPPGVVREGKIPAAWFLEQVGAKGIQHGGIAVADYHANLIFNAGSGTAAELRGLIAELKTRVRDRFGIEAEEEVQYVGFG
jgi:UDP-N-acetylmuramate dehydrogenase